MTNTSRKHNLAPPEQLEQRVLLTVKVKFNANSGLLKITGDDDANRIDLDGLGTSGQLQLYIDSTHFDDFTGVNTINVKLKGGNDFLYFNSIKINGSLTANLGSGSDELDIDNSINFGSGPDETNFIGGQVKADLGGNVGDLLDIDNELIVNGNASFKGFSDVDMNGAGTNYLFQPGDIHFKADLNLDFGISADLNANSREILLDNVLVDGTAVINGTDSVERVRFTSSRFNDILVNLEGGNDSLNIVVAPDSSNRFVSSEFHGGDGNDEIIDFSNLYDNPRVISGFETIA